ncbi:MAG: thioredoxin family protein [Granulosicoccus sp.]|nr:thioredoxin family protein [Granulosicoccus sp.]
MKSFSIRTTLQSQFEQFSSLQPQKKRRLIIKGVGALVILGASAGAISAYDIRQRTLHDLTVIGLGKPVIVQIHDPSCSSCRQLKSRTLAALKGTENIVFRLADVTTRQGREFQRKYNVETITLLLFDGEGKRINTIRGVQSTDHLKNAVSQISSS